MLLRRFASHPGRERIWALDLARDRIEEYRLGQVAVVKGLLLVDRRQRWKSISRSVV